MTDLTEEVARALWIEDANRAAPSVAKYRNAETFREQTASEIEAWKGLAQAAIAIVVDRCVHVARTTYAKDAFHFELGTAVAERILALSPNRSREG